MMKILIAFTLCAVLLISSVAPVLAEETDPPACGDPCPVCLPGSIELIPLGEMGEADGYFLLAEEIEDPAEVSSYSSDEIAEGERMVSVLVVIGNQEGEPDSVYGFEWALVDTDGFIYSNLDFLARADGRDFSAVEEMGVGEKARGWVSFSLPEDSIPAYIKYQVGYSSPWLIAGLYSGETSEE